MKTLHPFFCKTKEVRKTAWATPEYLSAEDRLLARSASSATTAEEFRRIVFETQKTAEAFFWRIIGWPEGMSYMRSQEYAASIWPSFASGDLAMLRAWCDGLFGAAGDFWIYMKVADTLHIRFNKEVTEETCASACDIAIQLAKNAQATGLATGVAFSAQGTWVNAHELDTAPALFEAWKAKHATRIKHFVST